MKFLLVFLISLGKGTKEGKIIFQVEDAYRGLNIPSKIKCLKDGKKVSRN